MITRAVLFLFFVACSVFYSVRFIFVKLDLFYLVRLFAAFFVFFESLSTSRF